MSTVAAAIQGVYITKVDVAQNFVRGSSLKTFTGSREGAVSMSTVEWNTALI